MSNNNDLCELPCSVNWDLFATYLHIEAQILSKVGIFADDSRLWRTHLQIVWCLRQLNEWKQTNDNAQAGGTSFSNLFTDLKNHETSMVRRVVHVVDNEFLLSW